MRTSLLTLGIVACGKIAPAVPSVPDAGAEPARSAAQADCLPDRPYVAHSAWSGRTPSLPPPPKLPNFPVKLGDAYTVRGAVHQLRSLKHSKDVTGGPISIVGYVVGLDAARARECAARTSGKPDPADCVGSFWIADDMSSSAQPRVRVVASPPPPVAGTKVRVAGTYNLMQVVASDMFSEPGGGVMSATKVETVADP